MIGAPVVRACVGRNAEAARSWLTRHGPRRCFVELPRSATESYVWVPRWPVVPSPLETLM